MSSTQKNFGFTFAELLCVIVIIASLATLIFPVIFQVKRFSYRGVCIGNLRQLGQACELYMADHDDHYPYGVNCFERVAPDFSLGRARQDSPENYPLIVAGIKGYVPNLASILKCPLDSGRYFIGPRLTLAPLYPNNAGSSYLFADLLTGQTSSFWTNPAESVWSADASGDWHLPAPDKFSFGSVNVLNYDWHVSKRGNVKTQIVYPSWNNELP